MVNTVPSPKTFTITSSAAASAVYPIWWFYDCRILHKVGPQKQTYGYGWGVGPWGGTVAGATTSTINEGGTFSDSDTTLTLTSATAFPSSGTIQIGS